MIIKSKADSIAKIKSLGLNHIPEIVAYKSECKEIESFCNKYAPKELIMRNITTAQGKFFFVNSYAQCLSHFDDFGDYFSLALSTNPLKKSLIMLGDIIATKTKVTLTASYDKDATHRSIYDKADVKISSSVDSEKLWKIKHFETIMDYIVKNNLYDVIVEFSIYSKKVGNKKDYVLITELRSNY